MFKVKVWVASCAVLACVVSVLADDSRPPLAQVAQRVEIAAIAPAVMGPDGVAIRTGPWQPYNASDQECDDLLTDRMCIDVFTPDDTGLPIGGEECNLGGPSFRYFYGHGGRLNPTTSNGMELGSGAGGTAERVEFAWDWFPKDKGEPIGKCEPMLAAAFTADDVTDECKDASYDPDTLFDGFMVMFVGNCDSNKDGIDDGVRDNEGAGYYYTDVCLRDSGLSMELPGDGKGAFLMQMLTCTPKDGEEGCEDESEVPATGSQPMLWDTEIPNYPTEGAQSETQHDDRNGDGKGDSCYNGKGAVPCPPILGQMYVLYGDTCGDSPDHCLYKVKKNSKAKRGCPRDVCPKRNDIIASPEECDPNNPRCKRKYIPREWRNKRKTILCPVGEVGYCKKLQGKAAPQKCGKP